MLIGLMTIKFCWRDEMFRKLKLKVNYVLLKLSNKI